MPGDHRSSNYDPATAPDPTKCYHVAVFTAKANIQEVFANAPAQSIEGGALMQFWATDGDVANLGTGGPNAGIGDYLGVQVNNTKTGGIWLSSFWDYTKTRQVADGGPGSPDVIVQ